MKCNNKRSLFSMLRTGEGILVTQPIWAPHLGEGMYSVASIPDWLRGIHYADMAPPLTPSDFALVFPDLGFGMEDRLFGCLWRQSWHSLNCVGSGAPAGGCWVFFLLLIQQLLLQTPTLEARGLKGGDRHPHFRVCAILFKCPQACDWYSPWQGTNASYGENNVWKNIALCFLLF